MLALRTGWVDLNARVGMLSDSEKVMVRRGDSIRKSSEVGGFKDEIKHRNENTARGAGEIGSN
jgi:hypothetical protein